MSMLSGMASSGMNPATRRPPVNIRSQVSAQAYSSIITLGAGGGVPGTSYGVALLGDLSLTPSSGTTYTINCAASGLFYIQMANNSNVLFRQQVYWGNTTLAAGAGALTFSGTQIAAANQYSWTPGSNPTATADTGTKRVAAAVVGPTNASSGAGWFQNTGGLTHVASNVTNTTATMAVVTTATTITLIAGRTYTGRIVVKCNNSVAAEGIQFDFNGGGATMTSFWAAAGILASGGTDTVGTNISTSLAGVINFSLLTGETVVVIEVSMVVNAGGTFIMRFAENTTASGTATVETGSFFQLEDSP